MSHQYQKSESLTTVHKYFLPVYSDILATVTKK